MARQLGIYSGTFDPVHPGHIAFAQEALRVCELDEVVFLPERRPRGKENVTAFTHRVALLERALDDLPRLSVVSLASDQFTVKDTLPELKSRFKDADLTLLVGSDLAQTFTYRWEGLADLLRELPVVIGLRSNDTVHDMEVFMDTVQQELGVKADYTVVSTDAAHLTSSLVREGNMLGMTPAIRAYIEEHGLYARP